MPNLIDFRQHVAENQFMYSRTLNLSKELSKKSCFLFGPRATGKSWLIRNELLKDPSLQVQVFDLLDQNLYTRFLRNPNLLESEISATTIVIDEIQKIPQLLDEVHRLIEKKQLRFLLTGSSARKLKRGGANLLAGRARSLSLFPLIRNEISNFDLIQYCNRGGLPMIYSSPEAWLDLRDYCNTYLKEEVQAEAIVRRVDHFARFFEIIGRRSGKELNYEAISRESFVPVRTVAQFVEVLKDTLVAFELTPFKKTKLHKSSSKSKIYFFDVGVANFLSGRKEVLENSEAFGEAFEHFIIQETRAALNYRNLDLEMSHWRAQSSQFEVDLILQTRTELEMAVEIKSGSEFRDDWLRGLRALQKEKKTFKKFYCVSRDPVARTVNGIEVIHWEEYLKILWSM